MGADNRERALELVDLTSAGGSGCVLHDEITRALDAAYARGRKEGLEEAARIVETSGRWLSVNSAYEAAERFAKLIRYEAAQRPRDDKET